MSQLITGLDVGTAGIRAVVVENRKNRPFVVRLIEESSQGLRKGAIADMAELMQPLSRVFSELKATSRQAAKNIYLNIGTAQIKAQHSKGVVAVSRADSEIYPDDVDRVVRASQAVALGPNRAIVHTITKEFIIDGVGDIIDPVGLGGNRLEVSTLIVDAFEPHVKTLIKAIQLNGGMIKGLAFDPLVAARASLSKIQKDLGTVLVDLGFGTTSMCVYEEGKLLGTAAFPIGSGNITNDIAIGLKIPVDIAEKVKLEYGYALSKEVGLKEGVDLKKFQTEGRGQISRRLLSEIIEARLVEVFDFVNAELKLMGKAGQLPGGAVLVGGGAKLPGVAELAVRELRLTTQIGSVADKGQWLYEGEGEVNNWLEDPEFVNVFGLVLWGMDEEKWKERSFPHLDPRQLLRYFLP